MADLELCGILREKSRSPSEVMWFLTCCLSQRSKCRVRKCYRGHFLSSLTSACGCSSSLLISSRSVSQVKHSGCASTLKNSHGMLRDQAWEEKRTILCSVLMVLEAERFLQLLLTDFHRLSDIYLKCPCMIQNLKS